MKQEVKNQNFDEERALYNLIDTKVINCTFAGPLDGESVLKETRNCLISDCSFSLRYPLWHAKKYELLNSKMDEKTRAPIWYATEGLISDCEIYGIKSVRECIDVTINNSNIISSEFGWKCNNVRINNSSITSEYFLLETKNVKIDELKLKGKYTFQYTTNVLITNSELDTKDAFWHSTNVTVKDSIVKGEYLGWFSDGLTLINCHIIGAQPLCYCKNLRLVNCTMEDTDLAFEYSDVEADVRGNVLSIKNPASGVIVCDSVGEIIHDHTIMDCAGVVKIRK